ncbi:MAG: DUF4430 domain-containing protein [Firmicutes bacterium]|nr:DUF4430 domain-containing protein [Bacillota bacterium]
MSKKMKIILGIVFVAIVGGLFGVYQLVKPQPVEGAKSLSITVVSDRDTYKKDFIVHTDEEFLGNALVNDGIVDAKESDFGRYITTVKGMKDDQANEYWWGIEVNHEMAATGMDDIAIKDGDLVTLTLNQGY